MRRGSLIIYDETGRVFFNTGDTGDAEGDILPNVLPVGLPFIETKFGELNGKKVISVDVINKTLITEDIPKAPPTYQELQQQLLEVQGVI